MERRRFLGGIGAAAVATVTRKTWGAGVTNSTIGENETGIEVDLGKPVGDLPHFWERCAGSDRTVVGLREQWRNDLVRTRRDCGIDSVRCHGLFDDEMGIAAKGGENYNFLYVDQIYDFMLDNGVKPFVELSFMPEAFASSANRIFFYRGNVSPPANWRDWHNMVQAFTAHCAKRYGMAEVGKWKFEVWNEPNIGFWAGTKDEYFELYRQSAIAIKSVNKDFQVGGPSTAQAAWIPDLIKYCAGKSLPLDFVSTHIYPDDPQGYIFGKEHAYSYEQVIPRAVEQVKSQVQSSSMPNLPVWITEWSSQNPAFISDTVRNCIGLAEAMSYWTFSNVFEEMGVPSGIFNSTFGMLDQWEIARPSFHTFALIHRLGERRLQASAGPVLATERADGSNAILLWNLIPATRGVSGIPGADNTESGASKGESLRVTLRLYATRGRNTAKISVVNDQVGSAIPAWKAMGSPSYPSKDQIVQLRAAAELPSPELRKLDPGNPTDLSVVLPPNGIALLEFEK